MKLQRIKVFVTEFQWRNFSWQTLNYAVSGFLLLYLWVVMANQWSATEFGIFSALFAFVAVYALIVDLGLDFYLTKRAAENSQQAFTVELVRFKLISSLTITSIFLLLGWWLDYPFWALLWMMLGGFVLNVSLFFSCYLRGTDNLQLEAIISLVKNTVFAISSSWLLHHGFGIEIIAASYFGINCVAALMTALVLFRMDFCLSNTIQQAISPHLRRTFGIWLVTLILGVSVRLDTLLLGAFSSNSDVAVFSAASRWYEALFLIITAFVMAATPKLVRVFESSLKRPHSIQQETQSYFQLLLLISLVASALLVCLARFGYSYLYDATLQEGVLVLYLLSVVFPVAALNYFLIHILLLKNQIMNLVGLMLLALGLNVVFSKLAIEWVLSHLSYSAGIGSAVAYGAKELILLVGLWVLLVNYQGNTLHARNSNQT